MMAKKRCYTTSLCKMLPTVLGYCNKELQSKVRKRADFDYLKYSGDTLGLINVIEQEDFSLQSAKYAPIAYHQA